MAYCVKGKGYHMRNWFLSSFLMTLFYGIAVSYPLFLHHFKIVPDSWIPLYVISQKIFLAFGIVFNFLRDDCELEMMKGEDLNYNFGENIHNPLELESKKGMVERIERYPRDELRIEVALLKMTPPLYLGKNSYMFLTCSTFLVPF